MLGKALLGEKISKKVKHFFFKRVCGAKICHLCKRTSCCTICHQIWFWRQQQRRRRRRKEVGVGAVVGGGVAVTVSAHLKGFNRMSLVKGRIPPSRVSSGKVTKADTSKTTSGDTLLPFSSSVVDQVTTPGGKIFDNSDWFINYKGGSSTQI